MQERIESSPLGRLVLSVVIVVLLVFVTAFNMPPSRLRDAVEVPGGPVVRAVGLDQDWRVFAPDPRDRVIRLEARVKFADGRTATWQVPRSGALVGAYWDYRWQKWTEHMLLDTGAQPLWDGATDYLARAYERPGAEPTEIDLVSLAKPIPPPGSKASSRQAWETRTFYRAAVAPLR
jgi:hypothetical protein